MRVRAVAIAVAALTLVACNGDDDSSSSTTPATTSDGSGSTTAPTSSTASTSEPAESTTVPTAAPTTEATSTTSAPPPTSSEPSTTDSTPPPSTSEPDVDEAVQARLDVIERTEESWTAVRALYEDPFNDDLLADLEDYFTGNQLEGFNNIVQQFRDGNFRSVPRDGQPEVYEAEPRSLALSFEAGLATVQVCHVNTALIVETAGNPDGTDRVARDEIVTEIVELELERVDGVWKVSSATAPEEELATCP